MDEEVASEVREPRLCEGGAREHEQLGPAVSGSLVAVPNSCNI